MLMVCFLWICVRLRVRFLCRFWVFKKRSSWRILARRCFICIWCDWWWILVICVCVWKICIILECLVLLLGMCVMKMSIKIGFLYLSCKRKTLLCSILRRRVCSVNMVFWLRFLVLWCLMEFLLMLLWY